MKTNIVSSITTTFAIAAFLAATPLPFAPAAMAQERSEIRFAAGNYNGAASGSITGQGYHDHIVGARQGQSMAVALSADSSTGNGTVYFNILPPGSDGVAIFNSSTSDNNYGEVTLPDSGDYTIRVYHMGNDEDAGATTSYTLSVTIM